jgi:hypothetical protein
LPGIRLCRVRAGRVLSRARRHLHITLPAAGHTLGIGAQPRTMQASCPCDYLICSPVRTVAKPSACVI